MPVIIKSNTTVVTVPSSLAFLEDEDFDEDELSAFTEENVVAMRDSSRAASGRRSANFNETRDAMGAYIPPPGGQPLSHLGYQGPGPAAYYPNVAVVKTRAPTHVIASRLPEGQQEKGSPGPKYNCTGDALWKKRKCTFRSKGQTYLDLYQKGLSEDASPANACLTYGNIGQTGIKASIKGRYPAVAGLQSHLIQPPDCPDFETPGPNYLPEDNERKKGVIIKDPIPLQKPIPYKVGTPGPNAYAPKVRDTRLPCTVKGKSEAQRKMFGPAPNQYMLPSYIGKGKKYTIGEKVNDAKMEDMPSPQYYRVRPMICTGSSGIKPFFTYRAFDYAYPDKKPGPAAYDRPLVDKRSAPAYSIHAPYHHPKPPVGPGPEAAGAKDIRFNDRPKWSFGTQSRLKTEKPTPAPNQYVGLDGGKYIQKKNPAYSFGAKLPPKLETGTPGPAEYDIREPPPKGKSFGVRHDMKTKRLSIAPNAYNVTPTVFNYGKIGVSLKSRHSPFKYTGLATNPRDPVIVDCQ